MAESLVSCRPHIHVLKDGGRLFSSLLVGNEGTENKVLVLIDLGIL